MTEIPLPLRSYLLVPFAAICSRQRVRVATAASLASLPRHRQVRPPRRGIWRSPSPAWIWRSPSRRRQASPSRRGSGADRERREDEAEEGEWLQHPHDVGGGETSALTRAVAAACANMDPSALVDALCLSGRSSLRAFLPALLGAPDPHVLLVRAVGGFLDLASAGPGRDASEWWANCVALIECAPRLAAPSADALAQAKRLAGHWKEMVVAGPAGAGGRGIGGMAGWGLLTFIASYNIVPEFDADEIVRLFDNIAPQVKDNCVELCKRLGLIVKMTSTCSSTSTLNDEFTCLISKAQCA